MVERKTWLGFLLAMAMVFSAGLSWAQQPTGSIAGTLTDPSGAVVPDKEISLKEAATGLARTTSSSAEGTYEFLRLRPSTYEITVQVPGFRVMVLRNIVVNVGLVVRADIKLEVGASSQTVEVRSATALIEPDQATIVQNVSLQSISALPMQSRQFLDLALTAPGTVPQAPGTQAGGFNVAGMRSQSNNFTLDGINNNDPQVNGPLNSFRLSDVIQEFNVETSIASSEVGRSSGAQVNIITKTGTNTYHGSLFYLGRNDALDANDFFLNRAGAKKNPLHRHQFGGTIGGVIVRDKTFWFFGYEGFRNKTATPITSTVLTTTERGAVTDPVSLKVLQFIPSPNTTPPPGGGTNWTGIAPAIFSDDTYFWRVDHQLTSKHHLTGRYAWFRGTTDQLQSTSFPFHGNITNKPGQHSLLGADTWASTKIVNEARFGFSRNRTFFQPDDVALNPATIFTDPAGNPLPGYVDTKTDPLDGGLPNISITGLGGLGAGTNMPQGRATNTYEAIDNVSWISPFGWSRHTFRFGGNYRHEITNRFLNGNYRGQVTFTTLLRFQTGVPRRGSLRTGAGGSFRTWGRNIYGLYFQDQFKATPNLTVNYGLRWESFGQSVEKYNRGSNFFPGVGMMPLNSNTLIDVDPTLLGRAALLLTPVPQHMPRSGQSGGDLNNFGPYLGIAWTPRMWPGVLGDGKTVIRTGFRVSFDDFFANIPVNMGLNFPPLLSTTLPNGNYTWANILSQNRPLVQSDLTVVNANLPGQRGVVGFNAWDYNAPTAYAMNYALEIERQIGNDYSVGISYVGTQGRKLGVYVDANEPFVTVINPAVNGDTMPNQRLFPFVKYAGVFVGDFSSNSNYNGMVATFRKRTSHGLSFQSSYTLGKSLDDNSSFFGSDRDIGSYADSRNRKADRGRSGYDVRHRFVVSYIYELPVGHGRAFGGGIPGWLNQFIGGWDTAGIFQYRSGFPFTIFAGTSFDYSGLNQFSDRPDWAPGVTGLAVDFSNPDKVFNCHFSTTVQSAAQTCPVFVPPKPGTIGNVGRNIFTGPKFVNFDFAVMKSFPVREGRRFQFRLDAFNFFNHTNFKLPSSNIQFCNINVAPCPTATRVISQTVGQATSAESPRSIQFGLRFDW